MTKPGVFDGLTAIDLTRGFAGALVGMVMADNGARVIRVEPAAASQAAPDPSAGAAGYVQWQRGKEIRELDLKDERGRSEVGSLAERADVLIESFRPGVMERLELGYPELSARNPGLVYCSISGFGPRGRYRRFKGYEGAVAAIAGRHMDMGRSLGRPVFAAVPVASFGASQMALQGVAAALYVRERTGTGQRVETSLLQGLTAYDMGSWFATQQPSAAPAMNPARGQGRLGAPGYMTAQTRDGRWLQFANHAPHLFWNMVEGLGLGHLRDDPAYAGLPAGAAPEVLERFWEQALDAVQAKTYAEWREILIRRRVGFDLMTTTEEGMDHPQVRHNGHVIQVAHPELGQTEQVGPLVRFGQTPSRIPGYARESGASSPPESREPPPAHALSGVTVLELAAMYAAPFGANLLADLGARVIKVEPLEGDAMRLLGALGIKTIQGKESIAVDLKAPEGQKIVRQLVERADLLMHNYRPGVPERLGIDYPRLREVNPDLVYLYAAAYGPDGPYAALPAYHPTAGAVAGNAIYQAGEGFPPPPDRELDMEERKDVSARLGRSNEGNPDPNSALVVGTALTLGLLARERHGVGQEMVTTMLCSNAYAMSDDWIRYEGKPARRLVDADLHGPSALYRLYETAEGWIFLACFTQGEWEALCGTLSDAQLRGDARFATPASREKHDRALAAELERVFRGASADEWEEALVERDVACVRADRAGNGEFMGSDPAVRENAFIADVVHPEFGPHWRHGPTVHLSATPGVVGPGTRVGENTRAVLSELGYTEETIRDFRDRKIVTWPDA